jgi:repressor of nif and glnA expression
MPPRNLKDFERSQALRAEIRRVWLELQPTPFHPRPTAKAINRKLSSPLHDRTVRWHMRKIEEVAAVELNSLPSRQCIE